MIIKQLYELQELDRNIKTKSTLLEEVRVKLADRSEIVSATQHVEQMSVRHAALSSSRRTVERSISDLEERLGLVETRLYGGAVTNARELEAAEEERVFIVDQKEKEENSLLEMMVEIEEVQAELSEAQLRLSDLESSRPGEEAEMRISEVQFSDDLKGLEINRDQIIPDLPSKELSLYESLLGLRDGHAVARVERGMCEGCRLSLSTMEVQRARSGRDLVQCSSCRRILYVV